MKKWVLASKMSVFKLASPVSAYIHLTLTKLTLMLCSLKAHPDIVVHKIKRGAHTRTMITTFIAFHLHLD